MRFFENGPDIPESLISAREEGRVVFFCGAGVSIPAGFPSFLKLTLDVMRSLGVPRLSENPISAYRSMIETACSKECPKDYALPFSFDQVFYLLQQEYGQLAVEQEVSSALRITKSSLTDNHKVILRLSKNANHKPQIVTTNFDLLFEQAQKGVRTHVQPALPDLTSGLPPEGVIYLHGRLNGKSNSVNKSGLIISSADFGRAYLADGWANRFIKELAQQYVIVLLGYSAEDPPVRYLLEGMHSKNGSVAGSIYAFDRGTQERVDQNWRHKGVNGIAFNQFDDLWGSLGAWADFSESPDVWKANAIELAARNPRTLSAFQREQVAHLVSSASGAESFYNSVPTPSAEWLCVFDPYVRNGKPETVRIFEEPLSYEYNPQECYGLESDPLINHDTKESQYYGVDFLSLLPSDGGGKAKQGQGLISDITGSLPARMKFLAAWLTKNLDDPWVLWWAAGKTGLNAHLLSVLEYKLWEVADQLPDQVVRHWCILINEYNLKLHLDMDIDIQWYKLRGKISKLGWNSLTLRYLERVIQPQLTIKRRFGQPRQIAESELVVTEVELALISLREDEVDVPDKVLAEVLFVWRNAIIKMVQLAPDLPYFPEVDIFCDDFTHLEEAANDFVKYYSKLFARLALVCPEKAKKEYDSWPEDEPLLFSLLKIFALLCPGLFSSDEVFWNVNKASSEEFWSESYRQKILELLVVNWSGFSESQRLEIEQLIISGPPVRHENAIGQSERYRLFSIVELLGGLDQQGAVLSKKSLELLEAFRRSDKGSTRIESGVFRKSIGKSGWVTIDNNANILIVCSMNQITTIAQMKAERDFSSFVEQRPFSGLIKVAPLRALKSLVLDTKKEVYPISLWLQLLTDWPKTSLRLTIQLARRLMLLPMDSIAQLSHAYSQWMLDNFLIIYDSLPDFALFFWDETMVRFQVIGDEALKSSIVSIRRGGKSLLNSTPLRDSASSSPLGKMTEALFEVYIRQNPKSEDGLPAEFKTRLELLLSIKSTYFIYAINQIAIRLDWLFWFEPAWVKESILPLFHGANEIAEAAWKGRLINTTHFRPELFVELKADFVNLFDRPQGWQWERGLSRILHQHLVLAFRNGIKDDRHLNFEEVRRALQNTDDAGRAEALRYLSTLITSKSAWQKYGKTFLVEVWPRELRYLSHATTNSFLYLAEKVPQSFPSVVKLILPFLTTVKRCDTLFYRFRREPDSSLVTQYPDAMLVLLDKILADHSIPPHQFDSLLNQIVESKPSLATDRRLRRLRRIAMEHI